jgi:hypothetical protein
MGVVTAEHWQQVVQCICEQAALFRILLLTVHDMGCAMLCMQGAHVA